MCVRVRGSDRRERDRVRHGEIGRQRKRQRGTETMTKRDCGRWRNRLTGKQKTQRNRQTETMTERHCDRETNRQTDKHRTSEIN